MLVGVLFGTPLKNIRHFLWVAAMLLQTSLIISGLIFPFFWQLEKTFLLDSFNSTSKSSPFYNLYWMPHIFDKIPLLWLKELEWSTHLKTRNCAAFILIILSIEIIVFWVCVLFYAFSDLYSSKASKGSIWNLMALFLWTIL